MVIIGEFVVEGTRDGWHGEGGGDLCFGEAGAAGDLGGGWVFAGAGRQLGHGAADVMALTLAVDGDAQAGRVVGDCAGDVAPHAGDDVGGEAVAVVQAEKANGVEEANEGGLHEVVFGDGGGAELPVAPGDLEDEADVLVEEGIHRHTAALTALPRKANEAADFTLGAGGVTGRGGVGEGGDHQ